jgi:2-methylcitrate dehydratase PrpD
MLYDEPSEGLNGKFSLRYNTALGILDRRVALDSFTDEKVRDPKVKEAMGKVRINIMSKWDPGAGQILAGNPVTVRTKDGRVFTRTTTFDMILGSQKNPWGWDNIVAKFQENARLALPEAKVKEAVEVWSQIDQIKGLREALKTVVKDAG